MAPSRARADYSESTSPADTPMTEANDHPAYKPSFVGLSNFMDDTPDYTDSDTNPNTTASSVAGDTIQLDGRKKRAEPFHLRKSVLGKKHGRLDESKEDDSIRRFRYLLGLTDLFRHFIDTNPNPRIKEIMAEIDRQNAEDDAKAKSNKTRRGGAAAERRRRTEQEEDAELIREEKRGGHNETVFRESPGFIKNGQMRDYQVQGLNWLISLHEN